MILCVRKINIIIAYKISGFVQVDRLRILCRMVNRSVDGNHCIFSRLKRERFTGTAKLPDTLNDGSKSGSIEENGSRNES